MKTDILQQFENETNNEGTTYIPGSLAMLSRPAQNGKTDLSHLFPEIKPEHRNIDARFQALMDTLGENFFNTEKNYMYFQIKEDPKPERKAVTLYDRMLIKRLPVVRTSTAAEIRANIQFLATTEEGRKLLQIPEGEKEVRIILGWVLDNGRIYCIYMEYELEHGDHYEIDFHYSPLDRHSHHQPTGFAAVE